MAVKKTKTTKKTVAAKNHQRLTMIPLRSWILFWFFVLATMTLVTVCFTNAFRNIDDDSSRETAAAFQTIRQNLEAQVAELQAKNASSDQTPGRQVITRLEDVCDLTLNTDPADSYIPYTAVSHGSGGVTAVLPYNFSWGNEQYVPAPYSDAGNFGPLQNVEEGCGVFQRNSLDVRPATSSVAYLKMLKDEVSQAPGEGAENIRQRTINGMTVLSYVQNTAIGLSYDVWEAFGRNYHYHLTSYDGWLTDAEAIKIIQSLKVVK